MGKKKSVVLLTLITIVLVALLAMIAVPSFSFVFKGSAKIWQPIASQYDLDADLGGGFYTHYYPEGVISEIEYYANLEEKEAIGDEAAEEYKNSYTAHKGLFLSTDEEAGIVTKNNGAYEVTETFDAAFKATANAVADRFADMGYSSFRVSVVDDYALKVELPASDTAAGTAFQYLSYTGEFSLNDGTNTVLENTDDESVTDYVKKFALKTQNDTSYIEVKLTKKGVSKIAEITKSMVDASASSLSFKVGENTILQLSVSEKIEAEDKSLYITAEDAATANVMCVVLNSALENGDTGIAFKAVGNNDIGVNPPVYGKNVMTFMYATVFAAFVIVLALLIVKYKGFGVAAAYSSATYFVIVTLCLALVTDTVFEASVGTVLMLLFGLIVNAFLSGRVYGKIKAEFDAGKTVESSVKAGYKKSLMTTVDVCAVLFGGAIALLIGAAGLHTVAIQAIICFAAAAFCSLLWTRVMNTMLLSAAKDKCKYFGFVREDDDDE